MLTFLLAVFPSITNVITGFFTAYKNAQVSMLQAKTGTARDVAVASINAQAAVQTKWAFAALPPAVMGLSVAIYICKCLVWDKVVGSFVGCSGHTVVGACTTFGTDGMSTELSWIVGTVVVGYFGNALVEKFLNAK